MARCDFSVIGVNNNFVYIVDTDQNNASITQDAANVIIWTQKKYPGKGVIYRDREGGWAQIVVLRNNRIGFYPVQNSELPEFAVPYVCNY